jgi:hypothetical protein
MRPILTTIIVAMLATACSGVQSTQSTMGDSASFVELIDNSDQLLMLDGAHPPEEMATPQVVGPQPQDADSDADESGKPKHKRTERPSELLGDGNPQIASETNVLDNDVNTWEVIGC